MIDYNALHPLQLSKGSHQAGSGKGCTMNVISYENGDTQITDFPPCSDRFLARVVQRVNDTICSHTSNTNLCPDCSLKVLELGHRTVGTNLIDHGFTPGQVSRVYVEVALLEARSVEHLTVSPDLVRACNDATQGWLEGRVSIEIVRDKSYAAADAAAAAAYAAAYAAADAANAAYAAAYAVSAAAYAAYAVYADAAKAHRLQRAHDLIDNFLRISGITATEPTQQRTVKAITCMLETV